MGRRELLKARCGEMARRRSFIAEGAEVAQRFTEESRVAQGRTQFT
jgi:hypothetical protein